MLTQINGFVWGKSGNGVVGVLGPNPDEGSTTIPMNRPTGPTAEGGLRHLEQESRTLMPPEWRSFLILLALVPVGKPSGKVARTLTFLIATDLVGHRRKG